MYDKLRTFLEDEVQNRESSGGAMSDYVEEAMDALAQFETLIGIVSTLPDTTAADDATLPCGHHHSLGVRNIESTVVSCELCEARDELRDALTMERELGEKARNQRDALTKAREALVPFARMGDLLNGYLAKKNPEPSLNEYGQHFRFAAKTLAAIDAAKAKGGE